MELRTTVGTNLRRGLTLSVLTVALGACAHGTSEQLVDARRAYDDAASSPARTRRPNELEAARVALDRAEDAHDKDPGSQREKRLATDAERKARIARAHGEAAEATRDATQAEHDAAMARARAAEAERSSEAAEARSDHVAAQQGAAKDAEREHEPRATTAHAVGGERNSEKARERRSAAALQNLASVATVREEPRGVVIALSGSLLFPSGQQTLSPIARQNLDQVAHALAEQPPNTKFQVSGHTDNTGTAAQNKQLSTQRARAVADQLVQSGIDRSRVDVEGYGETRPIVGNDTPEGQATNRRVEILVESNEKLSSK